MGCIPSKPSSRSCKSRGRKLQITLPQWHSEKPVTTEELTQKRQEFWETQPYYGGDKVVWETLQGIVNADDIEMKKIFIDSAGLTVGSNDLTVFYDQKGYQYELPRYVLTDPVNLIR